MDRLRFTTLDATTHVIGPGEYTVCGLVIPEGGTYTFEAETVCPDCRARATDTPEFGAGELPKKAKSGNKA